MSMKVVILCGGRGVRAFPFTEYLPKPMLPIGGSPTIVHIIRSYASQGFTDFVLAAGYRKSVLDDYFHAKDLGVKIQIVNTGDNADTGERIYACREHVGDTFMATYGDGLSDVPLEKVLQQHRERDALATMTCVPLFSQYGILDINQQGWVTSMREKPLLQEYWINAGFFVMSKKVFDHWSGRNLEREVFANLVKIGKLSAYQHHGFFKSIDSYKDQQEFDEIFNSGTLPWLVKQQGVAP